MSEAQGETTGDETSSVEAGSNVPHSSDAPSEPVTASAQQATDVAAPGLVPEQGAGETPEIDAPKPDADKADAPRAPGKVMIMSSGDRAWDRSRVEPESESGQSQGMFGKRRISALAAVVVLAAVAGALSGALATAGLGHVARDEAATTAGNRALESSIARIDADILALKASVEHTSKTGMSQFNKTSDRLDKVEKAQAEPAAKLARLSETVDKLRATPPVVPAPVAAAPAAAKDVTGSISSPAPAAAADKPKVEVARLPTVEGWVLRDVADGGALIEGRQGMFEVYAGDPVPGLGRIDAIRKQDGRWVVVTSKGLIVGR